MPTSRIFAVGSILLLTSAVACSDDADPADEPQQSATNGTSSGSGGVGGGGGVGGQASVGGMGGAGGSGGAEGDPTCGLTCEGAVSCSGGGATATGTATPYDQADGCYVDVSANGAQFAMVLNCDGSVEYIVSPGPQGPATWTGSDTSFVLNASGFTFDCTITPD